MSPVKANDAALAKENEAATIENAKRTGVGVRVRVGQTRGKNPSVITWDAFDRELVETLPKTIQEFMATTNVKDEPTLVDYLIDGFNDAAYSQASDEIGEFIEDYWDKDTKTGFRTTVRGFARSANMSIEQAVALLKPAIDAAFKAKQATA